MRVSLFKVDYWLAFGFGGLVGHIGDRVKNSEVGFQHEIVRLYRNNFHKLHTLVLEISERGIDSYGPREDTVQEMDLWIFNGIEGCVRILESRATEIPEPLDRDRLVKLRDSIDSLLKIKST